VARLDHLVKRLVEQALDGSSFEPAAFELPKLTGSGRGARYASVLHCPVCGRFRSAS
jgi:hypothetical protein